MDALLLDPEHPQAGLKQELKMWNQTTHAECLAQLAVHAQGREVLLADPSVCAALQEVADRGMCEESREHAKAALLALSDTELHADTEGQRHVMISYQWDVQSIIQRVDGSLKRRGYLTWFDLTNSASRALLFSTTVAPLLTVLLIALLHVAVKGSTVDAMSDAIEGAEVMCYAVSRAYKESANCRMELNVRACTCVGLDLHCMCMLLMADRVC